MRKAFIGADIKKVVFQYGAFFHAGCVENNVTSTVSHVRHGWIIVPALRFGMPGDE